MGRPKDVVQKVKVLLGVDEHKSVADEASEELAREAKERKEDER